MDLSNVQPFVTGTRQNDGLFWVEADLVDRPCVTRQFIENSTRRGVPDVHKSIRRTGCYLTAVVGPGAPQKVLFKVMNVALEDFHASLLGSEWSDVPYSHGVVHGVREQVGPL